MTLWQQPKKPKPFWWHHQTFKTKSAPKYCSCLTIQVAEEGPWKGQVNVHWRNPHTLAVSLNSFLGFGNPIKYVGDQVIFKARIIMSYFTCSYCFSSFLGVYLTTPEFSLDAPTGVRSGLIPTASGGGRRFRSPRWVWPFLASVGFWGDLFAASGRALHFPKHVTKQIT
jgi:hypothetical protein